MSDSVIDQSTTIPIELPDGVRDVVRDVGARVDVGTADQTDARLEHLIVASGGRACGRVDELARRGRPRGPSRRT